ncbi:MAG: sugar transferase [Bacteroidales bacterium]|nr:sugar transferase [Bacteroidales bacterium]
MKRLFDFVFSCIFLIVLLPFFIIIIILILFDSWGNPFYLQERVGKNANIFYMYKFRTMYKNADKKGLLTIGSKDNRITRVGFYLRKYKLDELPQLINVFWGNMSFVGPRPEVMKYVALYNDRQRKVLNVKPGITDLASLTYFDESDMLAQSTNPEEIYIKQFMPVKLDLNLQYIESSNFITDFIIILKTVKKIFVK